MKKLRKIILLVLCMAIIFCFGGAGISVYAADDTVTPPAGEVVDTPDDNTPADDKTPTDGENVPDADTEPTEDITAKIKAILSESDYFTKNILPLVISAGSALLMGIGALLPYLKKNAKYKQLLGLYKGLQAKTDELTKAIQEGDPDKLKEALTAALGTEFTKVLESLKIDKKTYAEIKAQIDTISAQLSALINGATNAWRGSETAVACLTATPTQSAVEKQAAEIKALEDYIRETKGDEADKVITDIKSNA
nr:MAG TPA: SMODS and SLOG-associating 2TM effector domain family 4 [Caudoviricetes sp.]